MDTTNLDGKLKKLIMTYSAMTIGEEDIKEESDLINDFGFDSVQIMRFLVEVEKEFGIGIHEEDLALEIIGKFGELKKLILDTVGE